MKVAQAVTVEGHRRTVRLNRQRTSNNSRAMVGNDASVLIL